VADSSTDKELVRATCKLQLDLSDMCATDELREAHRRRGCCGAEGGCSACQAAKTLRTVRRECARVANISMRLRWAADAELVDRYQIAHQRAPKGKEWEETDLTQAIERVTSGMPPAERAVLLDRCTRQSAAGKKVLYPYPLLCAMAPGVAAGIVSAIDQAVMQKWNETRWASLVQMDKSPPHYGWTNPIPLRKADVKLQAVDGKRFLLSFSVSSKDAGRRGKEFSIPIYGRDDYQMGLLTMLSSDQARMGALQLTEDRKRPGRWYVRIAYRKLATKSTATKAAGINKGLVCFLAAATEDGQRWQYDGADIEAYLQQVQSRRRRYQRQVKASNRIGHGRTRTLRPIEHLQGQGEAWRDTRCQTIARRFVGWLITEGVGRLYIDDFSGIRDQPPEGLRRGEWIWNRIQEWPFYKLQMKVISCCEENGIECVIRNPKQISGTCPKCRSREVEFRNRKLHCKSCRHVVHWDIAAAQVNLLDGERERRGEKEVEPKKTSKKPTTKKSPGGPSRKA
jgi:Putative transposase DNA-binding domain/Probable transposase